MSSQGKRIRKIREALGLSGSEFGKRIGVSRQYVSNLEADRNVLNNEKLVSLLIDMKVNINYILGAEGEMFNIPKCKDEDEKIVRTVEKVLREKGLI